MKNTCIDSKQCITYTLFINNNYSNNKPNPLPGRTSGYSITFKMIFQLQEPYSLQFSLTKNKNKSKFLFDCKCILSETHPSECILFE